MEADSDLGVAVTDHMEGDYNFSQKFSSGSFVFNRQLSVSAACFTEVSINILLLWVSPGSFLGPREKLQKELLFHLCIFVNGAEGYLSICLFLLIFSSLVSVSSVYMLI